MRMLRRKSAGLCPDGVASVTFSQVVLGGMTFFILSCATTHPFLNRMGAFLLSHYRGRPFHTTKENANAGCYPS